MMRQIRIVVAGLLLCALVLPACSHSSRLHSERDRKITLGIVQKSIKVGMPSAEVAAVLGSPNMVTRSGSGGEAWVYDKVATESSYSESSGDVGANVSAGGLAGDALVAGTVGGGYGGSSGAQATTQRTLTVIIRFDDSGLVESFSYHTSQF